MRRCHDGQHVFAPLPRDAVGVVHQLSRPPLHFRVRRDVDFHSFILPVQQPPGHVLFLLPNEAFHV
jgi:hypothetical protein